MADDDLGDLCKDGERALVPGSKDIYVQLVLSFALGISAFTAFCILRPRWKTLYAARKRQSNPEIALPVLPDSFLGWIPALYRVTEEQVLASAGLDAFVFLSFFRMALRLFGTMLFFSVTVLWPIHKAFDTAPDLRHSEPPNSSSIYLRSPFDDRYYDETFPFAINVQRRNILHKLEEAWSAYRSQKAMVSRSPIRENVTNDENEQDEHQEHADENGPLLSGNNLSSLMGEGGRPKVRLRFGFLKMRNRKVDALDYYEEQLRQIDGRIRDARKKEYAPAETAFVTMDSIAACQMAIQATVDPRPGQLLIKPAPSPYDVIWKNTYAPRYRRRLQSGAVTIFITSLTILWFFPVAILAQLLSICSIKQVAPSLAESLQRHDITRALVRTGLPTLVVSLLNVLVPYLYDYLSNIQGSISQGEVELSVISKNFFFVFFNIFVVYAVSGSAALADFWQIIKDSLSDTNTIAAKIAQSIQSLSNFYLNFIMLQGFGLFPFKLLQFGSVSMYPFYRMGAKTPRDFAELVQPNLFNYGFYLPTALLVFILCLVYSVLPGSALVLLLGVCYFGLGYFVYKYQLLYSMDQPQHATGGAWPLICRRIILGLVSFQVVMLAILVLRKAFSEAALIGPLVVLTFWYNYYFHKQFIPLTKFIALRSIKRNSDPGRQSNPSREEGEPMRLARRMSTIDEDKEKGMSFINPSLITPLEQPWIYQDPPPSLSPAESAGTYTPDSSEGRDIRIPERYNTTVSTSSSLSLGDTHVWRERGDNNV
ncbi:hypothetical protein ONZ43_g7433 [Nemania bipapillata]|uniref:Uncharacterized protein n=1 Tax=Nemania bipapillata TaxID=110536 RepID=A0ACC2HQT8_9PEZI|nr:hypothetical protein ONZ43_g7433 [Nemania bipapillata]